MDNETARHIDEITEHAREAVRGLRATHDEELCNLLRDVIDGQRDTREEMRNMRTCMMDVINRAFPGGDYEGHGRYHQTEIEFRQTRRRVIENLISRSVEAGWFAGVGFILWAVFLLIKDHITK